MLDQRITVYVPGTINVDQPLGRKEQRAIVNRTLGHLAGLFGGATADSPSTGAYVSKTKGLVLERIVKVYAFTDKKTLADNLSEVIQYAGFLAQELGQESVSVEVNGALHFVESIKQAA